MILPTSKPKFINYFKNNLVFINITFMYLNTLLLEGIIFKHTIQL